MKKIHVLICMIALLSVTSCVNLDLNPVSYTHLTLPTSDLV